MQSLCTVKALQQKACVGLVRHQQAATSPQGRGTADRIISIIFNADLFTEQGMFEGRKKY